MKRGVVGLLALACMACSQPARGQGARKSQLAGVTQSVSNVNVTIVYRRPVARGRPLFGALVKWGKVWTPSADSAARITFSAPVTINGASLAAGTYGIWAIPDSVQWTLIFNRQPEAFHLNYPDGQDALRVHAAPTTGDYVETLLFSFPMVDADSARLELHWGTTVVPLMIRSDSH